ncbi:MAG: hypothetical protein DI535_14215 [Citrobacter freundii]|nr:MAG: hypothetical protein DI535_14215 [Citrobacter freundii]
MSNSCAVFWKDELVGYFSIVSNDMWYYDGRWACADAANAREFETLARSLDQRRIREFPEEGLLVQMSFDGYSSLAYMLVLGFVGDDLVLRLVSPESAAYLDLSQFPPWQIADNGKFFEEELKREVSFFHPLRFKQVSAIGLRRDRDDVLFKLLDGSSRYAVVHLTYKKERSRKFPATKFYKDWKAFYDQELANLVVPFDIDEVANSIVQEAAKHGARCEVHSFDSGAMMIDLYWKDQLYVVQLDDEQLGLSEVTENIDFSTVPDRSFRQAVLLVENVRRIFQ